MFSLSAGTLSGTIAETTAGTSTTTTTAQQHGSHPQKRPLEDKENAIHQHGLLPHPGTS